MYDPWSDPQLVKMSITEPDFPRSMTIDGVEWFLGWEIEIGGQALHWHASNGRHCCAGMVVITAGDHIDDLIHQVRGSIENG